MAGQHKESAAGQDEVGGRAGHSSSGCADRSHRVLVVRRLTSR